MKIWKPLTKFKKHRNEHAWHADLALEEGEVLALDMGDCTEPDFLSKVLETCPKGKELKVHVEICVEPFDNG